MADHVPFRCDVSEQAASATVAVHGDLDLSTVSQMRAALRAVAIIKPTVTLDLRGLSFIDAAGLGVILETQAQAAREDFNFYVIKPRAGLQRVFSLTRAAEHLMLVDVPQELPVES